MLVYVFVEKLMEVVIEENWKQTYNRILKTPCVEGYFDNVIETNMGSSIQHFFLTMSFGAFLQK